MHILCVLRFKLSCSLPLCDSKWFMFSMLYCLCVFFEPCLPRTIHKLFYIWNFVSNVEIYAWSMLSSIQFSLLTTHKTCLKNMYFVCIKKFMFWKHIITKKTQKHIYIRTYHNSIINKIQLLTTITRFINQLT